MSGRVTAVHRSATHEFSKTPCTEVTLIEGIGVAGDAHSGVTVQHRSRVAQDPDQPNLRQVHLIHAELFDDLAAAGFRVQPGELGENLTTAGVDLLALPVGTRLRIGPTAVVTLTGLRNPCRQIENFRPGLLKLVVSVDGRGHVRRLAGVMGVVSRTGTVRPGDRVGVDLPPAPHHPMTRV